MRKQLQVVAVVMGLVSSSALAHEGEKHSKAPAKAQAKGPQSFGKAFTAAEAIPVAKVLGESEKYEGKSVKITGVVTKVCQAKGCWFEVAADGKSRGVRIKSADYSIFVPMDSAGKQATVEGTLISKTLSEAQAKHLAEDGAKPGEKVAPVKGPQKEFQVAAVAVELR